MHAKNDVVAEKVWSSEIQRGRRATTEHHKYRTATDSAATHIFCRFLKRRKVNSFREILKSVFFFVLSFLTIKV